MLDECGRSCKRQYKCTLTGIIDIFLKALQILTCMRTAVVAKTQLRNLQERNRARICSRLFLISNFPQERIQRTHKKLSTSLRKHTGALPIINEPACVKQRNGSRTR